MNRKARRAQQQQAVQQQLQAALARGAHLIALPDAYALAQVQRWRTKRYGERSVQR